MLCKKSSPHLLQSRDSASLSWFTFLLISMASSHKAVMDMEIKFLLQNFTEKPGSLKDHLEKMACGKIPLFPATLSLVYTRLTEKVVGRPIASGSGVGKSIKIEDQHVSGPAPATLSTSTSIPSITSSGQHTRGTMPPTSTTQKTWLRCPMCQKFLALQRLSNYRRCPRCPSYDRRFHMRCSLCGHPRRTLVSYCVGKGCGADFM